jgi:hypothetical protein
MTKRMILRRIPTLPEMTTAAKLAEQLPYLSRSTIDRALREGRFPEHVEVFYGSGGKHYGKWRPGSLL